LGQGAKDLVPGKGSPEISVQENKDRLSITPPLEMHIERPDPDESAVRICKIFRRHRSLEGWERNQQRCSETGHSYRSHNDSYFAQDFIHAATVLTNPAVGIRMGI
jgi:hypothetical protein